VPPAAALLEPVSKLSEHLAAPESCAIDQAAANRPTLQSAVSFVGLSNQVAVPTCEMWTWASTGEREGE
jgi:hypothetical protein